MDYIYLQPFYSKHVIDEANAFWADRKGNLDAKESWALRVEYAFAAGSASAQAVGYFALWVITSLASTLLMVSQRLSDLSDSMGNLCMASAIGAGIATVGIIYLPGASWLSKRIIERADAQYKSRTESFVADWDARTAADRHARVHAARASGENAHPEYYFGPAVRQMHRERADLAEQCQREYPRDVEAKAKAMRTMRARLRSMHLQHRDQLYELPITRSEIDVYLVKSIAAFAEEQVKELYDHSLEVWATRIKQWGPKFDREGFSRRCLRLYQSRKVARGVEQLIRDVKEAENKYDAFRDSRRAILSLIGDMKRRVNDLYCPWFPTRIWRRLYPKMSSWSFMQTLDRLIDPDIALAKN